MGGANRTQSKTGMKNYIVWDIETTGLQKETAEIIEIGVMHIKDGKVEQEKSWLLNHDIEIKKITNDITGITKEMIDKDGEDPKKVLKEFMEILTSERHNLTHNGFKFDIPWLLYHLEKHLGYNQEQLNVTNAHLLTGMIDTAVIVKGRKMEEIMRASEEIRHYAYRIMSRPVKGIKYNLALCCDEMGIKVENQHRALADVKMTNEIYKKLTKELK